MNLSIDELWDLCSRAVSNDPNLAAGTSDRNLEAGRLCERTGEVLIAVTQALPYQDVDFEPRRERMPVRGVNL